MPTVTGFYRLCKIYSLKYYNDAQRSSSTISNLQHSYEISCNCYIVFKFVGPRLSSELIANIGPSYIAKPHITLQLHYYDTVVSTCSLYKKKLYTKLAISLGIYSVT
jgi:hypothetical protein